MVAELSVQEGDWVSGRPLTELELHRRGARILGIQRYEDALTGRTTAQPGDVLSLYAPRDVVDELDRRRAGDPAPEA